MIREDGGAAGQAYRRALCLRLCLVEVASRLMAPSRNVRFESVDDDDEGYGGGLKGIITGAWARARGYSKSAKGYFKWAVKQSVLLGWIVATTTIISAMPLLLELQREQAVIELEKVQVKELLAQGYSPQDVQRMGLTLEPSVLSK